MVYLICFESHFHHAKHYIGFTESEETFVNRMERHRAGDGARLLRAVTKSGMNWKVVRIWADADRTFERKLKNSKKSKQFCPVCNKNIIEYQTSGGKMPPKALNGKTSAKE